MGFLSVFVFSLISGTSLSMDTVMSHLLVCAVEDPGMPNPNKHITAFGQTLKQADITFGSLSEVLR